MSLRIRCASCRRGTSSKHSLCKDCRGSSSSSRSSRSSRSNHNQSRPSYTPADHYGEYSYPSGDAAYYGNSDATGRSAEAYRDAGRYLGRDARNVERDIANGYPYAYDRDTRQGNNIPGVSYVRPRVHPYQDRYDYISANVQYVYPSHNEGYPNPAQRYGAPSSHAGYGQPASGTYYAQPSQAPRQQASGQPSQMKYEYSGTEGPDGEIID